MCDWAVWVGRLNRAHAEELLRYISYPYNTDATGVALHVGSDISILKAPGDANNFIGGEWTDWFDSREDSVVGGLMHARLATHGRPEINVNNHPHYSEESGSVLMHKGVVYPKELYPAVSECDSEQILHSLDRKGLVKGIMQCPGSAAVAYIAGESPWTIRIFTNQSPVNLVDIDGSKLLSTKSLLTGKTIPCNQWMEISLRTGEVRWGPQVPFWRGMQRDFQRFWGKPWG